MCVVDSISLSHKTEHDSYGKGLVTRHLAALRADPRYKHALIMAVVEANMSYRDADTVSKYFRGFGPFMRLVGNKNHGTGVHTGYFEKLRYLKQTLLNMKANNIYIEQHLIGQDPRGFLDDLRLQLLRYKAVSEPQGLRQDQERKIYVSGKDEGKQDDKCMAFQMAIFWTYVQCSRNRFLDYLKQMNFELYGT